MRRVDERSFTRNELLPAGLGEEMPLGVIVPERADGNIPLNHLIRIAEGTDPYHIPLTAPYGARHFDGL